MNVRFPDKFELNINVNFHDDPAIERRLGLIHTALTEVRRDILAISAAVQAFVDKQNAFNTRQGAAIDKAVASGEGLKTDMADLKETIRKLQESTGPVTPEDQALIDEAQGKSDAMTQKMEAFADALSLLDSMHPPAAPTA